MQNYFMNLFLISDNTKERLKTFINAMKENKSGRKDKVVDEVNFIIRKTRRDSSFSGYA